MGRLQASEVATLVIGVVAAFLLLQALRGRPRGAWRRHLAGAGLVLAACVCTIAEGFAAPGLFNFLEHLCLALAGLVFLAAAAQGAGAGADAAEGRGGSSRVP